VKNPLLQSLFDDQEPEPLTVSQLNAQVRSDLERRFSSVWVEGEIVNFAAARSGHWYFTLHDGVTQIKVAVYKASNWRIRFQPFDGLQVRLRGRITLYEPRGEYQMLAESLEPVGEGALKVAFEEIRSRLEREGLFDVALKRALPPFPRKVGVVTSPNGAAFFDILHVLSRRTRSVSIVLIPTRVQGENSGEEIRQGILFANEFNLRAEERHRIDVLIVGRGGGSSEDLWAFNEERLARAIRGSLIPVISAVGHEVDFTIADLVADLRAATPSAAAEMVAQREDDLEAYIHGRTQDLAQIINYKLLQARSDLQELALAPVFAEFPGRIRDWRYRLDDSSEQMREAFEAKLKFSADRLERTLSRLSPARLAARAAANGTRLAVLGQRQEAAIKRVVGRKEEGIKVGMASLDALSPLSVLGRGFSITENERGDILRDVKQVKKGDQLKIRLANGKLKTEVLETEE
jgi:exodeoxyribonuclease VII large subunit